MNFDPLTDSGVSPADSLPPTYWHDTVTAPPYLPLEQDFTTDYLVIGGGYTGISAALTLAQSNAGSVTVIDSHSPGFGCAGRNAGFVLSGSGRLGPLALQKRFGMPVAQHIQAEFDGAVSDLLARVQAYNIDCDLTPGPYYKLAHTAEQAQALAANATALAHQFQQPVTALNRSQLHSELPVQGFYGATRQPGYTLNPLKLIVGLAETAKARGVNIFGASPATAITRSNDGYTIATPGGTIKAGTVLIASSAYSNKKLHPMVNKRQFPVQSSILVTEPLTQTQCVQTGLNRAVSMMDTRKMKYYYRLLPDNRLLFGGRGEVAGKNAHRGQARLHQAMADSFPALRDKTVSHFWSGWVSVSMDSLPRVFFDYEAQIGYAMGYCGAGVSFANMAGRRLAQQATGQPVDSSLPLYNSPLPRFPLASLRRTALRALYSWARITER